MARHADDGAPLVLGAFAELDGHTEHAEVCRAVLRFQHDDSVDPPHPEVNLNHPDVGTILHWAASHKLHEVALAIVACKHFSLLNEHRGCDLSTALHIAAAEGMAEVVEALLHRFEFTASGALDADGFTALHGAAFRGHRRVVQLLLDDPALRAAAARQGCFDAVRPAGHWATEASGICDCCTALHCAASRGHADICETLLALPPPGCACCADATNRVGATALHMAARGGYTAAVSVLLGCPQLTAVNARDVRGATALHYAALQSSGNICALLMEREDFTAADARDLRGRTASEIAASEGHHEVRRLILQRFGWEGDA